MKQKIQRYQQNKTEKSPKYTIRKLSVGVGSVLIGFSLISMASKPKVVHAETVQTSAATAAPSVQDNITKSGLYLADNKGDLRQVSTLNAAPTDLSKYIVKTESTNADKSTLYGVSAVKDAGDKYTITASSNNKALPAYSFDIQKTPAPKAGTYTNFNDLVSAIDQNPAGKYVIGADLYANENTTATNSYITKSFTGTLTSDQGSYSIYNAQKPLFNEIKGATVNNVNLKDLNINSQTNSQVASLAINADNAKVSNVHVSGNITADNSIGGLIANASNSSVINNSSFEGNITATNKNFRFVGGLVGNLTTKSQITNSYVDANITAISHPNEGDGSAIGGLVGINNYGMINTAYVKGQINNEGDPSYTGAIMGTPYFWGRVTKVIDYMKVDNGYIAHGDVNYTNSKSNPLAAPISVYKVDGMATGRQYTGANTYANIPGITEKQASAVLKVWKLAEPTKPVELVKDYTQTADYSAANELAYENMTKLMPFANDNEIVKYGNLATSVSKLNSAKLVSVIPVSGNQIVDNPINDTAADALMLHFADGTVDKLALKLATPSNGLVEYKLANDLVYTPAQVQNDYADFVRQLNLPDVQFLSANMMNHFKQTGTNQNVLKDLYLTDTFNDVKKQITQILPGVIANSSIASLQDNAVKEYLTNKIQNNYTAILLGLSYLNRLYDVNFANTNIKDIMTYYPDFYNGKDGDALDALIKLGNMSYDNFKTQNNVDTYVTNLSEQTGISNLFDFLNTNRQLFDPEQDDNTWFKNATKAYIYETPSKQVPDADVKVYHKLQDYNRPEFRASVLPLLNLKNNDVFVVTNMNGVIFGMYERYIDYNLRTQSPDVWNQKVKEFDQKLPEYAQTWADYFDAWYRLANDEGKKLLINRNIPTYDGYRLVEPIWRVEWADKYDEKIPAVVNFFGPIGQWYAYNRTGAYSNGDYIHYVSYPLVSTDGSSIFTHEMTHNYDGSVFLYGYGRRESMGMEAFAEGLLQSPMGPTQGTYGLNLVFDFDSQKQPGLFSPDKLNNRVYNKDPERFQQPADLDQYMHGVFNVTYLLDYAEAQAMLPKTVADKQAHYRQISYKNNQDVVSSSLDASVAEKLTNLDSLIDNNIVTSNWYSGLSKDKNSYMTISMYDPIYAGIENNAGSMGGIIFRKTAFELMAEKGYINGLVPYASNQLKNEAVKDKQVFADPYIFNKVLDNKYPTYADFKKAMFKARIDEKDQIKPISITYNGATKTINSFADLQALMNDAIDKDLVLQKANKKPTNVTQLKSAIMNQYTKLTGDFKDSIFKMPTYDDVLVEAGSAQKILPSYNNAPAQNAVYQLAEDTPAWITINSATGELTASPASNQTIGEVTVKVAITYPDQKPMEALVNVFVAGKKHNQKANIVFLDSDNNNKPLFDASDVGLIDSGLAETPVVDNKDYQAMLSNALKMGYRVVAVNQKDSSASGNAILFTNDTNVVQVDVLLAHTYMTLNSSINADDPVYTDSVPAEVNENIPDDIKVKPLDPTNPDSYNGPTWRIDIFNKDNNLTDESNFSKNATVPVIIEYVTDQGAQVSGSAQYSVNVSMNRTARVDLVPAVDVQAQFYNKPTWSNWTTTVSPDSASIINEINAALNKALPGYELAKKQTINIDSDSPVTIKVMYVKVDKTGLQEVVNEKANVEGTAKYYNALPVEQQAYNDAVKAGQSVLAKADATQAQVNDAKAEVVAVRDALSGVATDKSKLQAAVDEKAAVEGTAKYFNAPKVEQDAYNDAVTEGQAVLNKVDATQAEVDQAKSQVEAAKNALSGLATDKSKLQEAVAEKPNVEGTYKYYNASQSEQQAYNEAIKAGQAVLNKVDATQTEVDQTKAKVDTAQAALNGLPTDKSKLQAAVDEKSTVEDTYKYYNAPQSEQQAYDNAIIVGQIVLAKQNITQAEVDQAEAKVVATKNALSGLPTDKSKLQEAVDEKLSVENTAKYYNAPKSEQDAYNDAVNAGQSVLDNADVSQVEVDQAKTKVDAAKNALSGLPTDKSKLQVAVDEKAAVENTAKYYNAPKLEQDTYNAAVKAGQSVLAKGDVTQVEVDQAKAKIDAARDALSGKPSLPTIGNNQETIDTTPVSEPKHNAVVYTPVINNNKNWKIALLNEEGQYTGKFISTNSNWKVFDQKIINSELMYRLGTQEQWIPAKYTGIKPIEETASDVYIPLIHDNKTWKVALLDEDGNYTGKFITTSSDQKVFAQKMINGELMYRIGTQEQWIPAKYTGVKPAEKVVNFNVYVPLINHNKNWKVALMDQDGNYTGKFISTNSNWKVLAQKMINGRLMYRIGTQEQWVPARFVKMS